MKPITAKIPETPGILFWRELVTWNIQACFLLLIRQLHKISFKFSKSKNRILTCCRYIVYRFFAFLSFSKCKLFKKFLEFHWNIFREYFSFRFLGKIIILFYFMS